MNAFNGVLSDKLNPLNPADHNPRWITKADKRFAKRLDFKDIKLPVKTRDIHKIEKKNSIGISVFGYKNKEKYPMYVSKKCCKEKHVDLLIEEEKQYVLINDFNRSMSNHSLHCGRKYFVVAVYTLSLQRKC